eukprot:m.64215 g.64215  ORF g.64215 m.64215 type:complete len:345 (-) comp13996_c0_seq7:1050-2084(-)
MPQVFLALRCYNCKKFQVQQKKKIPKWTCCICQSKQSVQKVFLSGAAKDCRSTVQRLNLHQGELEEQAQAQRLRRRDLYDDQASDAIDTTTLNPQESQWTAFGITQADDNDITHEADDDTTLFTTSAHAVAVNVKESRRIKRTGRTTAQPNSQTKPTCDSDPLRRTVAGQHGVDPRQCSGQSPIPLSSHRNLSTEPRPKAAKLTTTVPAPLKGAAPVVRRNDAMLLQLLQKKQPPPVNPMPAQSKPNIRTMSTSSLAKNSATSTDLRAEATKPAHKLLCRPLHARMDTTDRLELHGRMDTIDRLELHGNHRTMPAPRLPVDNLQASSSGAGWQQFALPADSDSD